MAAKSHRAGLSRIHPTLCAPSPLHLCSTFVSIASVQGTEAVDVSILHPCSACVGHTTLSAAEMSVAEHSPCLGGGKGKPSRTLWDYLISSWPVKSRDFQAGLLGEVGQGKKQRTRAMEERGVEAVLLQRRCTTEQLWTGHASKAGRRQERGSTRCPQGSIERCSHLCLSWT